MLVEFHPYGFLIGLAMVLAIFIFDHWSHKVGLKLKNYYWDMFVILSSGLVGARLWHVVTDYYLYKQNLLDAIMFWQGGLSILGAVAGGLIGLWWVAKREKIKFFLLSDCVVMGMPFAQSLGRWGNYFNGELFGLETTLPWGMELAGKKLHPLFLYESILMLLVGVALWLLVKKKQLGSGLVTWLYIFTYSLIRFGLDFLRPQKTLLLQNIGFNQMVFVLAAIISFYFLWTKYILKSNEY